MAIEEVAADRRERHRQSRSSLGAPTLAFLAGTPWTPCSACWVGLARPVSPRREVKCCSTQRGRKDANGSIGDWIPSPRCSSRPASILWKREKREYFMLFHGHWGFARRAKVLAVASTVTISCPEISEASACMVLVV